ncbi:hypothetical protein QH73_0014315 [Scytonema millei VB511283]|uniref:Uncharacterized protein n=1 Tax=Scytonema millei VB511283 TaxID=1245923 RepID=A0A9X5E6H4_9CYAN|nr:hypothetical protein [Scytonema millei VB511283]
MKILPTLLLTNYQLPTTNYQLPTTNYQFTWTNYKNYCKMTFPAWVRTF